MGDFSNYEKQGAQAGKTVPYEVTELVNPDGSHPLVHVEHLGMANASIRQWVIARAGDKAEEKNDDNFSQDRDLVAKHCAKRVERLFFSDGTQATEADIPDFIRKIPLQVFIRMRNFVQKEENFCEFPIASAPKDIAEK